MWGQIERPLYNFSYGFYRNRRREQAILIQNCVRWRLRNLQDQQNDKNKSRFNHTSTLRDISNAFPSMAHKALNRRINQMTKDEEIVKTLRHRYTQSYIIIRDTKGDGT